jgi:hypothetical protein
MKKEDTPQDKSPLENHFPEMCYVKNEKGEYDTSLSKGWDVKVSALDYAWDDIHEKVNIAKIAVEQGKRSPVYYYMEKNMMTVSLLASYMKINKLRVWLHLRPWFYKKISKSILQRYAKVFAISLEEINTIQ